MVLVREILEPLPLQKKVSSHANLRDKYWLRTKKKETRFCGKSALCTTIKGRLEINTPKCSVNF